MESGKALKIKNVQFSDQGTYVCVAVNGVGAPVSQSVSLEVYGQAQHCHRMIESDTGSLEIEPSSASCLWIIKLKNTTGIRLQLDPQMMEPIQIIPEQSPSNSNLSSFRIKGSNNDTHEFKGKSLAIVVPPRREKTTLHWTGLVLDDFGVSSSTEFKNDLEGTLEWEPTREGTHKIFWAFEREGKEQLRWTLNTTDLAIDLEHPCESISLTVLEISLDGNVSEIEKTCEGSSINSLTSENRSQVLILLHMKSIKEARSNLEVTWRYHVLPLKMNVEGILAGCESSSEAGAYVIPFNSTPTRLTSSNRVLGLAFDWNSRRIYSSQNTVGIVRSNLDGSESETLLSDPSLLLCGIAIDPISGNLYYGSRSSRTIRICNNDAVKCSLIASSSYVWDIAVHPSKGLLFWSIWGSKVFRANLDGSNATILLDGLKIRGIDVDEHEDRLYWGSPEGIRSCDLNGQDIQVLPNFSTSVEDVAIDGDKVHYVNASSTNSIHIVSKSGMNSSLVTKLPGYVQHIALFGRRVSNRPPNPCKISQCAHLCIVMSPSSFQCMCPENKTLKEDGRTCQP